MVRWHGFLNPKVPGSNAFQQPPLEKVSGTISVRNLHVSKATVCDANGLPVAEAAVERAGKSFTATLPTDALYVVLR